MVGTAGNTVIFLRAMSASTRSGSNLICSTACAPLATVSSMMKVSPNMWNSGNTASALSASSSPLSSGPVIEDVDHGTEVRVRQHGPLGLAGGAAGVLQHGDLALERPVRVAREGAVIGEERGKIELAAGPGDTIRRGAEGARDRRRQKVLDAADHKRLELPCAFERRDLRIEHRQPEGDHDLRLGVGELILQLARRGERTEVDNAAAGHQHREEADHEVRRVRQVQAHMHAGADAERLQPSRGPRGKAIQLAKGESAIVEV